jgi:hypothetical protein
MFRAVFLPIIRSFVAVQRHRYNLCSSVTECYQDQDGTAVPSWSWSCSKAVYKLVWHIPLLSVKWINSWWWTEELSETCRVSCQNKFVKLVHLVGYIIKKFVTVHGHTNVKFLAVIWSLFHLTLTGLYNHSSDFFFCRSNPTVSILL